MKKYRWVYWNEKKKRFQTRIGINGKKVSVGSFKRAEDASAAVELFLSEYNEKRIKTIREELQPGEIFKDISEYEGVYQISNFGRVKSFNSKSPTIILKPIADKKGYYKVGLNLNGKKKAGFIHILVAEAFLNHKSDGTHKITVDHIDNNKANNSVNNLQLVSNRFNSTKNVSDKSKYPGVYKSKNGKWFAAIRINSKSKRLGTYDTELEAASAYYTEIKSLGYEIPEEFTNLRNYPY